MGNKVKYFEVESGHGAEVLINTFSKEYDVFASQILPLNQNGTTLGFGVFMYYKDFSEGEISQQGNKPDSSPSEVITNYDRAKLNKTTTQESPPTKEVKMASDKQIKFLLGLGYKGETNGLTAKNAFNLIQNLKQ
jgi:hypothetical protein